MIRRWSIKKEYPGWKKMRNLFLMSEFIHCLLWPSATRTTSCPGHPIYKQHFYSAMGIDRSYS